MTTITGTTTPGEAGAPTQASAERSARRSSAGISLRRAVLGGLSTLVHMAWPFVLIVVAWHAWVVIGEMPPAVAPRPGAVWEYVSQNPSAFVGDTLNTVKVVGLGLLCGSIAGIALASIGWFSPLAWSIISGPALVTQCLPIAVIVPVVARIFGYNEGTVVIIAGLIAFFPILVFTSAGFRATPAGADDLFVVLGARRLQAFRYLALPSAIPRFLVSLRMSVVSSVVGAMLAQWIMGTSGLGYRLVTAQVSFRGAEAWGAAVVAVVLGVVLYSIANLICRWAERRLL